MITTNQETIEDGDGMGFHPGFPPNFDPKRAEKGLAQEDTDEVDLPQSDEPTLEDALEHALTSHVEGAATRWLPLQRNGATDAELLARIADEFQGCGGSSRNGGWSVKGGKSPQFTWFDDGPLHKAQKLKGKRLLAKVREVLEIGAPGSPSAADKKRLHKEAVARFRGESDRLPDSPKCVCGETEAQHDGPGGVCGLADCNCCGFTPAIILEDSKAGPASSIGHHPQMLQMIPIGNIEPSPTNPRKHFDQGKLQELADSISEHGLIEPILVRPRGGFGDNSTFDNYELVAGERRWRASKLAGLKEIEAKVRGLDDKAVLEIQFIENLQRSDLSAIEEAEGYKRLLDEHGYTADSLAGKLAKSKSYVYGRLKLCNLPAPALEALAKGDLPPTVGELIGRLPNMEMRERFWDDNFSNIGSDWFETPSFRDVRLEIEQEYMRELKSAPFSETDKKLVPEAGSCKDCPKRTGNNRGDYPDGRADICTDTRCYELKLQAYARREAEKAKESGAQVLSEKEAASLFNGDGETSWIKFEAKRKYVVLEDKCQADEEGRAYANLLEGHLTPVVAIDPQGKSHLLAPRAEAEKILKEQHGIKSEISRSQDSRNASEKKRQDEKKVRQATAAEIVERALLDVDGELFTSVKFLRLVAKLLVGQGHADVARPIAKRRGIEINAADVRGSVEKIVDGLDDADVPGFLVEWLLQGEMESWAVWGSNMAGKFPLCGYFGLKPTAVMKEVAAKQKADAKAKPKGKAKAAPGR